MGEIFLARQAIAGVNRLVVLKRLLPGLAEDAQLLGMFIDEARIAANLAHPNIVQVHEFGEDEAGYFIVMEYVPGVHVGQMLGRAGRDNKPIPLRLGALIMYEVARAIDHAHHARDSDGAPLEIVHRDISPSNVLVSFQGDVKLMDFGVARAANRAQRTNDGSIRGKFAYMAPEQIESKQIDSKTDVFAAGILMWELTLGRRLFTGPSDFETIRACLEAPIPRPTSLDPEYPPILEELVMAALERSPSRRLASAAELAAGIKVFLRANPTDREDLAAFMANLFPDDVAESARLDEEHTTASVALPTVILGGKPTPVAPASLQDVATASPSRRGRMVLALLLLAAVSALVVLVRGALDQPQAVQALAPTSDASSVVAIADDASSGNALADAEPTDASVIVQIREDAAVHLDRPRPRRHDAGMPRDAGVASVAVEPPRAKEVLDIFLGPEPQDAGSRIRLTAGPRCTTEWLSTLCKQLVVGSAYDLTFSVSGGESFTTKLQIQPAANRCFLSIAKRSIRCVRSSG